MTMTFQNFGPPAGLLAGEDVLPQIQRWQAEGQRCVLVTLVAIEGGAPRHPGAQMAVAEDGRFAGYLSGGCLEAAVVHEAQAVIAAGQNRLVRYGKGSPYFDIKLPCGSGLDLYFDQAIRAAQIADVIRLRAGRRACQLRTELSSGRSTVEDIMAGAAIAQSEREGGEFKRIYTPALRLLLLGNGPALAAMATLAAATGIELMVVSSDDATRAELAATHHRLNLDSALTAETLAQLDFATAAILYFHAHEQEPELLSQLLKTKCFYVGALGNHAVHRDRLAILAARGFSQSDLARIRAPVGSIAGAKSKATLAVGALAQMLEQAKVFNLVA